MKKIRVISCFATIAVMALIFFFSSQDSEQSSAVSGGLTERIAGFINGIVRLFGADRTVPAEALHGPVRKLAHFTIYTALGISAVTACRTNFAGSFGAAGLCTAGFGMLYAVSDEFHQMFSDGRTPMLRDVMIDTAGVAAGIMIVYGICRIYKKRRRK